MRVVHTTGCPPPSTMFVHPPLVAFVSEEAALAMAKLEDVIHNVAGHLGGKSKLDEPGGDDGHG